MLNGGVWVTSAVDEMEWFSAFPAGWSIDRMLSIDANNVINTANYGY